MNDKMNHDEREQTKELDSFRKKYAKPNLRPYGNIRDLTFGVTGGIGDTQDPTNFQP
jgi:hypothetical protein